DTHTFSLSSAAAYGSASVDQDGTWHYTVSDAGAVDALAAGETLSDTFTVKVADNHGGFASQDVKITITGTNDAPVITSTAQSGAVSEGDDGSSKRVGGADTCSAVAANDTLMFSVSNAAAYGSASVDQDGSWHYTVKDAGALDPRAAGETQLHSFPTRRSSDLGGFASQDVKITITGTNDAPVITSAAQSGAVSEGDDGSSK